MILTEDSETGSGSTGSGVNPIQAKLPTGKTNYAGQWNIGHFW
jgi:hypothetical protein